MRSQLHTVNLEITERCPLRCPFCSYDFSAGSGADMDRGLYSQLIAQARQLGAETLLLSGGEPTMHPGLFDMISEAASLGFSVGLSSSGVRIDDDFALRLRQAGLSKLHISLCGPTREIHSRYRQAFDESIAALQTACRVGLERRINWIASGGAIDSFDEMLSLSVGFGATLCVMQTKPRIYRRPEGGTELVADYPDDAQLRRLASAVEAAMRRGEQVAVEPCFGLMAVYSPWVARHGGAYGCIAGCEFLSVSTGGRIMPCNHLWEQGREWADIPGPNKLETMLDARIIQARCILKDCRKCAWDGLCRPCATNQAALNAAGIHRCAAWTAL